MQVSFTIDKLEEELSRIVPPLSRILLICDEAQPCFVMVEKKIAKAKFRVSRYRTDFSPPEDIKAIVAIGDENLLNLAKYRAAVYSLPLISIPTSVDNLLALSLSSLIFEDGIYSLYLISQPSVVVLDKNMLRNDDLALALVKLVGCAVAVLDYQFYALAFQKTRGEQIILASYKIIDTILENENLDLESLQESILKANIAINALSKQQSSSSIIYGSPLNCFLAAQLLAKFEDRELENKEWVLFDFIVAVLTILENYFNKLNCSCSLPPENNQRINFLSEYFGLSLKTIAKKIRKIENRHELDKRKSRIEESAKILQAQIYLSKVRVGKLKKLLERISPRKNFEIDKSEYSLCLALSPDIFRKYTAMSFLKDEGELEGLLSKCKM